MTRVNKNVLVDLFTGTKRMICFLMLIGCSSCYHTSTKKEKLNYFVPQTNQKGQVKRSLSGDTLWHTIPPFSFIDEQGNELTQRYFNDNIVVVDFFFTTCPSICIPMSQNLVRVQEHFKNTQDVKILSHTVDPNNDTPEVLMEYAKLHGANPQQWKFVTGDKKELYKQAREGYFITALDGDGSELDFIHSEKFVLIDKNKNIRGFFRGTQNEDIEKLIMSIEKLRKE